MNALKYAMTKRDWRWWVKVFVHNILIHPMLPFADVLEAWGLRKVPNAIYYLHNKTAPAGN